MKRLSLVALFCVLPFLALRADPVTVQEVSVSPSEIVTINVTGFYNGGVYAGINNLLVDSVATEGFCIDPFHFSVGGPQPYNTVDLTDAPKNDHLIPGMHMTGAEADLIAKLWAIAYDDIAGDPAKAAALQIAIWEVIGGADFHLTSGNDYGAALLLTEAASYTGPIAHLIALTGPGQDYVIAGPVPEAGATIGLLLLAAGGLFLFSRVQTAAPAVRVRS